MPPHQHADLICGVLSTNKRLIFRLVDSFNISWHSCGGQGNTGHQHPTPQQAFRYLDILQWIQGVVFNNETPTSLTTPEVWIVFYVGLGRIVDILLSMFFSWNTVVVCVSFLYMRHRSNVITPKISSFWSIFCCLFLQAAISFKGGIIPPCRASNCGRSPTTQLMASGPSHES